MSVGDRRLVIDGVDIVAAIQSIAKMSAEPEVYDRSKELSENAHIINLDLDSLPTAERGLERDPDRGFRLPVVVSSKPITRAKIVPNSLQSVIISDHKQHLLRKIGNAQAEIGRLNKLLDEIRVEVLTTD